MPNKFDTFLLTCIMIAAMWAVVEIMKLDCYISQREKESLRARIETLEKKVK